LKKFIFFDKRKPPVLQGRKDVSTDYKKCPEYENINDKLFDLNRE